MFSVNTLTSCKPFHTELLAPAKDLDCGVAAIDCGADAVYIGAARFGAREKAGNPLADIAALTTHAHTYWARVYVTVNTLLYDDELPQALSLHPSWLEPAAQPSSTARRVAAPLEQVLKVKLPAQGAVYL